MKDGMKNYRNMMKNMEKMGMEGSISDNERAMLAKMSDTLSPQMRTAGSGVTSDAELKSYKDALGGSVMAGMDKMAGMTQSDMLDAEKESMIKMLEKIAPDKRSISDIREAIDALMSMGFDREGVLEILESTPGLIGNISDKEQVMPRAMTEGALGSLPDTPRPMTTPERLDADRTQSMDMQKTGMGT
jgi:hypothetical protein